MKSMIRISTAFIVIFVAFSSCKKDDKIIPDITGSTYELYRFQAGSAETIGVTSSDANYFKWKFVSEGILENGNGNEVGTWSQTGEDVYVTYFYQLACKIRGNDLTANLDLGNLGSIIYTMRKI
jgi:hypothetical protein